MSNEADKLMNLKYCQQDVFEVVEADSDFAILKDSKGDQYKLRNTYPDIFGKYLFTYASKSVIYNAVIICS